MLDYRLIAPTMPGEGAPLVVLLHGRGATEDDLAPLARFFPDEALFAVPRAPFPAAPWGYGPGWAWYRYLAADRPDPESFGRALDALDAWLAGLADELPVRPGSLVLGGFSQGATTALGWSLQHPDRVAGVLVLSGFLADHPRVPRGPGTAAGLRVFWGHGSQDPAIPFELALRGWDGLREAGASLEARSYPMGHAIAPEEVRQGVAWLLGEASESRA